MVHRRVVFAEESFLEGLRGLRPSWGYVIGYEWGDYFSFLAETPEIPEEESDPMAWSIEHGKQVLPLLPGGLTLKGIYYAHSGSPESNAYPRAHQTLQTLSNTLKDQKDFFYLEVNTQSPESPTLCAIELSLSKMASNHSSKKFVDLQFKKNIPWTKVKGHFVLDFNSFRTSHATDETADFTKHMKSVLTQLEEVLNSKALITFNHEFKLEDEEVRKAGGEEAEGEELSEGQVLDAQILLDNDALSVENDETMLKTTSKLKLGGKVSICAFLRPGATIREACDAVIQDILRSLRIRFQIHSDTLEVDDKNMPTEVEGPVIHEPPRRVLVPVPFTNNILISDYLFSGETSYDSTVSVQELFGFTPVPDEIDDDIELIISPSEIKDAEDDEEETSCGIGAPSGTGMGFHHKYSKKVHAYYVVAIGVLLASVALYYFLQYRRN